MIGEGHPVSGLRRGLLSSYPDLTLEFSRYIHFGPGRTLSREIFHVQARDVDSGWLEDELQSLSDRQELALHSKVTYKGKIYHIPMIDFAHREPVETVLLKLHDIRQPLPVEITLYDSGRSLHGYYFCLIDEGDWYRFLGSLLLCNPPDLNREFTDSRWIGHSLEHGFSALRWSHHSDLYRSLPELVDFSAANRPPASEIPGM